ncbi:hypothetical protein PFLA_a2386 [Pseudoalteromonas flavipulchra NCIMB 2033 = ATCC BAA-314]|nr:hypothetical protein [Pseudoalteromonas flavipulchra NCIMB 2033 = ATCC BAA-314]
MLLRLVDVVTPLTILCRNSQPWSRDKPAATGLSTFVAATLGRDCFHALTSQIL